VISWTSGAGLVVALAVFAVLAVSLTGCGGSTDDRPPTWPFIASAIIEPSCATASCHSDIAQRAGVNLYKPDVAYATLLDRHFVIPTDPSTSELMYLLRAQGARRMPPDFALPERDITLIENWITSGAAQK
jgi:hypothetical protein